MNNKGMGAVTGITIGLVAFIILAFIFAIGSGILMKVSNDLTTGVVNSVDDTNNMRNTTLITAGNANNSIQQLSFFSWILIIGMVIGVLIASYMLKPSGVTMFFWFLISSGIFVASVFLSRAYQDLYYATGYVGEALHMTARGTSWLIIYLPRIVIALAFIGGIILYMRMKKSEDDLL